MGRIKPQWPPAQIAEKCLKAVEAASAGSAGKGFDSVNVRSAFRRIVRRGIMAWRPMGHSEMALSLAHVPVLPPT